MKKEIKNVQEWGNEFGNLGKEQCSDCGKYWKEIRFGNRFIGYERIGYCRNAPSSTHESKK